MLRFLLWLLLALPGVTLGQPSVDPLRVEIVRDRWGVPHVFGPDAPHVAYGLGWAVAEDQFYALQTFVAMGQGKMGLLWGVEGVALDFFREYTDIERRVRRDYAASLSQELQDMFDAYAAAANRYAELNPKEVRLKSLFPVRGADLVCAALVIEYAAVGLADALMSIRKGRPDEFIVRPGALGSNAFAFRSQATTYGATTLVMNPHVPLYGFIALYEAQLRVAGRSPVHGAFIAGLPFPLLGATPDYAWTVTFNWPDLVDIYRLVPARRKNHVLIDGQEMPLQTRKIRLRTKLLGLPVSFGWRIREAPHGPVFYNRGTGFATRFVNADPVGAFEQWSQLSACRTVEEARAQFQRQALPTFNFMAIDAQDNVGSWFNAVIPDRAEGWDWQRTLPGDRADLIWNRHLPFDSMPQYRNPACGYLYNTNNSPFCGTDSSEWLNPSIYDSRAGFNWNRENNRALRVRELLFEAVPVTDSSLRSLKWDVRWPESGPMPDLADRFAGLSGKTWSRLRPAIETVRRWNRSGDSLNMQAALPLFAMLRLFERRKASFVEIEGGIDVTDRELAQALRWAARHMRRKFGGLEVPLSQVQIIRRDERDYPMAGLPDALNAVYAFKNRFGKLQMYIGENFTAIVKYKDGILLSLETIVPFGSTFDRESEHYDDQTPLFVKGQLKRMTFDEAELRLNASRVEHPGRPIAR